MSRITSSPIKPNPHKTGRPKGTPIAATDAEDAKCGETGCEQSRNMHHGPE